MRDLLRTLHHTCRRLGRSPMFTGISLLTLAIGIGANTAIFSLIEGVLLKPLPYPHPERLIALWHTAPGVGLKNVNMAPSLYFVYSGESRVFEEVGMWTGGSASVTGIAQPEEVEAIVATNRLLPILGVQPVLGRPFRPSDDDRKSERVVMLTDAYWRERFSGDPGVIGRRLILDGEAHQVIGVLPRGFQFMDRKLSLITPLRFDPAEVHLGNFSYEGMARVRPGVTLAQATADVSRMMAIAQERYPAPPGYSKKMFEEARLAPDLRPLHTQLVGDIGTTLWVLMGTVGMVLLIACANVANLLLVRADGRRQELAIRAALGAGWGTIAKELLIESTLLGLAGGALGLGLASIGLRVLTASETHHLPRMASISIDPAVLAFTFGISLAAGLVFGLIPVIKYASPHLAQALRGGGRSLSQSRERHRARSVLVVVQVALALVLMAGSGLMIRTFQAMRRVDPGFRGPEQVQSVRLSIPQAEAKEPERVLRMEQDILDRARSIVGVKAVAVAAALPMQGWSSNDPIFAQDKTYREGALPPIRRFNWVSPGFVAALGTRLVAGREVTWTETAQAVPVAMVSEALARELWQNPGSALGKRIRCGTKDDWREVIGVVADIHSDGVDSPAPATVYWPLRQKNFEGSPERVQRWVALVVRTPRAGSASLVTELRRAVWNVDANLPLASIKTLEEMVRSSMERTAFTLTLLAIAGGMALLLGVVGIYGVISYSVAQRRREIGIRLALGAPVSEVTGMFVRHGLILSAIGTAIGLAAAFGLTRLMKALLFQVSAGDPVTFAATAAVLVLAAVLASYLPARRAMSVDPCEALRSE
jgi:putative ABC transport system permease protein